MSLQAWFDDSGGKGTGRWMVVSGLFGEADVFASIATEWEKHLAARYPRRIDYFKMYEAINFSGCFEQCSAKNRDEKVLQMAALIDRRDLTEVGAAIDLQAFSELQKTWGHYAHNQPLSQPYILGVYWALLAAVREAMDRKYTQRMEVFFDVHDKFQAGISQTYKKFYDDMAPPDWRQVMPYHPSFRDDEEFVILQAADLLAGQDRLSFENNPNNPEWVATLCKKLTVSKYYMFFDANKLNAMSHDIKFREVIEAFSDDESSASADSYGD